METLTYEAKIAIIKILTDIINADNITHPKEIEYLQEIVSSFELNANYTEDVNKLVSLRALAIIRELTSFQRNYVAQLMGNMITIDKDINYNEVKLYNVVCKSCNITKGFQMADSEEYTYSGPSFELDEFIAEEIRTNQLL